MKHLPSFPSELVLALVVILFCSQVAIAQAELSPRVLGEKKYQELKGKGLLPQPKQVPAPKQLGPENIILPEKGGTTIGKLLIPLDETFTRLSITGKTPQAPVIGSQYTNRSRKQLLSSEALLQVGTPIHGVRGSATQRAVVNFSEIADQEQQNPAQVQNPKVPPLMLLQGDLPVPGIEKGERPKQEQPQESESIQSINQAPPVATDFQALTDNNASIPPDVGGAVGPNHIMTTHNTQIRIHDRTQCIVKTVTLDGFWASVGNPSVFDPKVLYDPYNNRWIFTATANAVRASSSILIGVSQTDNPSGAWNLFRVDADPADTVWADYPSIGFNKNWIVVQVNMFRIAGPKPYPFRRSQIYVFKKNDLYDNVDTYTLISNDTIGAVQVPAITYDNTINTEYLLQNANGNPGDGNGYLRLYTITGAIGSEVLTPVSFISTAQPWDFSPPNGQDFAPQPGTTCKIQNNDSRLQDVVYRNGSLWAVHTVFLPAGGAATRSAVQWWNVTTAGAVSQRGRVDDATGNTFYAFPSIAVNQNNDVLIGYAHFSATQYASAYYSFRFGTDLPNALRPEALLKCGEAKYCKTFGSGQNRWGDYTSTVVDPMNDIDLWTIQEYASTPDSVGGFDRWGTWWGKIEPGLSVAPFTNGVAPEFRNDDGSTNLIPLSFPFTFYATAYNQVYINNNGNLSFTGPYFQYTPNGFPISNFAMIAAFWGDVDTRNGTSGVVYYKSEAHRFTVIWNQVGYYNQYTDKLNQFEIIITDGTDCMVGVGKNVCFSYGDMQWTTGSASGGVNGFGGAPATVGANAGDGVNYALVGRFDHAGFDYNGPGGNPGGISYLNCKRFCFNVAQGAATISGTTFRDDSPTNCARDLGEPLLQGWAIKLSGPNGLTKFATTDQNGNYFFSFLQAGDYTVSEVLKPNWIQTCPAAPGTHSVTITVAGGTVSGKDFGNKPTANVQDLSVDVAGGRARPGFPKFYGVKYENKGTLTVNPATVMLSLPAQVTYTESSPGGSHSGSNPGGTVTWNVGSVPGGAIGWLWAKVQIPPTTPRGTILTSSAVINPVAGDVNPADNSDNESETVRGSFDPNEIAVSPGGVGPYGTIHRTDTLQYQIEFQNTGTDTAFNIAVHDLLPTGLDLATVDPGASTHPYTFAIVDPGELVFTFSNINLPDSNVDETGSRAFVRFKVLPRSDVATGADLPNNGSIYFDFNPPVATNTVSNRIGDTTTYRSFSPESLALAKDNLGKIGKPVKRGRGMPNAVNVIDEAFQQGVFPGNSVGDTIGGTVVGVSYLRVKNGKYKVDPDSAKKYGWLRLGKWDARRGVGKGYTDVLKTLYKNGVIHDSAGHGFSFKGQKTSLSPLQDNNKLVAEQLALKVNMLASLTGKTRPGFGELQYADPNSSFNNLLVRDIAAKADSALTLSKIRTWDYVALDSVIGRINHAFEGPIDTESFVAGAKLRLSGVRALADVGYLQPPPLGVSPPRITPAFVSNIYPEEVTLQQNYPNPFNPTTTIQFDLPQSGFVTLKIFNVLGQEVATLLNRQEIEEGTQEVRFQADHLASGIYFYRLDVETLSAVDEEMNQSSTFTQVKKMLLIR